MTQSQYYVVYTSHLSMQPDSAHEILDVMCANAAANLGYSTTVVYPNSSKTANHFRQWLSPFHPQQPDREFIEFFDVQDKLQVAPLLMPPFLKEMRQKWFNFNHILYRYYLPFHVFPKTKILHTRDWNCAKAAVKARIPTVYERHYFQDRFYEPEIVQNPFFKLAITQSEPIRESVIQAGIPAEKAIWTHNGFSPGFLERQPEEAQIWRNELLKEQRQHLVVYSGALYRFKGVDLLIDVAKQLPHIQFALTGGTEEQVQSYRQLASEKQVYNVDFLGWILPFSRLVSLLQSADVLAHPHCAGKSANFTNPIKFFQYIASGTPIVATEIPPLMEFKFSPIISAWCEPDNPTAFAQAIEQVLKNYPRKVEGYLENIEFARQFSWEERTKRILSYVNPNFV